MRSRLSGLILSVLFASPVAAQQIDRHKLRELIELPETSITCGAALDARGKIYLDGEVRDVSGEIAALEKELRGDASDLERWCKLYQLYTDDAKCKQAAGRALELARAQLQREPNNPRVLRLMGEALWDSDQLADAETSFRQAVRLAPRDAECQLALGEFLVSQSDRVVVGDRFKEWNGKNVWLAMMSGEVRADQFSAANVAGCRKLLDEARLCYDRAVAASSGSAKYYVARAGLHIAIGALETLQRPGELRRQDVLSFLPGMCSADIVDNLAKAAELSPGDSRLQLAAAFFHFLSETLRQPDETAALFYAKNRHKFAPYLSRLEKLVDDPNRKTVADACYALAVIEWVTVRFEHSSDSQKWARRAVTAYPAHNLSWELLCGATAADGKTSMAGISEEWIQAREGLRNRYLAARARWLLGQFDKAEEHLRAGLRCEAKDVRTQIGLAAVLLRRGDEAGLSEAGRLLAQAGRRFEEQKEPGMQSNLDVMRGFHQLLSSGKIDDDRLKNACAAAFCRLGEAAARKNEHAKVVQFCDLAIRLDPGLAPAFHCRGMAQHWSGKLDEAFADFSEAIRLDPRHAPAHCSRGMIWAKNNQFKQALEDFDTAIRLDPKDAVAHRLRGGCRMSLREYDRAIEDFDLAAALGPYEATNFSWRGTCRFHMGDYDKAIADYTQATRLNPADLASLRGRGTSRYRKGELAEAIKDLSTVIQADPKDVRAFGYRVKAWFDMKDYDQALKDIDALLTLEPRDASIHYEKARCLALQGKTDAAFDNLARALELGWRDVSQMTADRSLDSLRSDPRYAEMLRKYVQ